MSGGMDSRHPRPTTACTRRGRRGRQSFDYTGQRTAGAAAALAVTARRLRGRVVGRSPLVGTTAARRTGAVNRYEERVGCEARRSNLEPWIAKPVELTMYESVIGLEIHAQLLTETKIFCGCLTRFGDAPNTHVCPVCVGLPGALPVLNRRAVELAIRAALVLGCRINEESEFARKNYFYPDLPKGYQISQYDRPLASQGAIEIAGTG